MAIRHLSTTACDNILQGRDGRLSFIGTFRNIHSPSVPFFKSMGICVELAGDHGSPFRVSIMGSGIDTIMADAIFDPPSTTSPLQQAVVIIAADFGARFDDYGTFNVFVHSGTELIHSATFGVIPSDPTDEVNEDDAVPRSDAINAN